MRITYIGFGDFHRYAGMKQLYHFAQEVGRFGYQTQILIAGRTNSVSSMDEAPLGEIAELEFFGSRLTVDIRRQIQEFAPDLLHVWTPRFVPALAAWQVSRLRRVPVILNHEDDEDYHVRNMRQSWTRNWSKGLRRLAIPVVLARNHTRPWLRPLHSDGTSSWPAREAITSSHLERAVSAHTAISPNLVSWAQRRWPDKPVFLLYPGAKLDLFKPGPPNLDLQERYALRGTRVLIYTGTMSLTIFEWFLDVLRHLVSEFPDIRLLLIGEDGFREQAMQLAKDRGLGENYILIGQQPYAEIPRYLSLADILLQHPLDLGNEMRLPAKLPEYLAMGKPVITFAGGIGRAFDDGVHVRKLYGVDSVEAAAVVKELLQDPIQRERLGVSARAVAADRFDWSKNGRHLIAIYDQIYGRARRITGAPA